jgi:Holliday junction resolvase RusA-like endonuclease
MAELSFMALGDPVPQGSKNPYKLKTGQVVLVEAAKGHKSWRATVKTACELAGLGSHQLPLDGALALQVTFVFAKPPNTKFTDYPAGKPDLSKLIRSVEDSITNGKGWVDDARVVDIHAYKRWVGSSTDTYTEPGVLVYVTQK